MFTDERHFVTLALASVSALVERDYAAHSNDLTSVQDLLGGVIEAATPVRARGVIMAAKGCLAAYDEMPKPAEASDGYAQSVMTLDRLVNQYASGLYEIDPEFAPNTNLKPLAQNIAEPGRATDVIDVSVMGPDWADFSRRASATLESLLPMVHDHDRPALEKLLKINRRQNGEAVAAPSDSQENEAPLRRAAKQAEPRISIEALMLPVTNALLSTAHSQDIPISVSYGLGNLDMAKEQSALVTEALIAGGNQMILALPQKARLAGTVQIAITAYPQGQDIRLDMRVPHIDVSQSQKTLTLNEQAFSALKAIGGDVSLLSAPDDVRQDGALMRFLYRNNSGARAAALKSEAAEQSAALRFDESSLQTRMSEALA